MHHHRTIEQYGAVGVVGVFFGDQMTCGGGGAAGNRLGKRETGGGGSDLKRQVESNEYVG